MSSTCKPSILWNSHKFSILQCQKIKAIFMHGWKLNEFYVHMRWCRQQAEKMEYSDANSITLLYRNANFTFLLIKIFVQVFQWCMCVCVCNVYGFWFRLFWNFGLFGDLAFHSIFYTSFCNSGRPVCFSFCMNFLRRTSGLYLWIMTFQLLHINCFWISTPYIMRGNKNSLILIYNLLKIYTFLCFCSIL